MRRPMFLLVASLAFAVAGGAGAQSTLWQRDAVEPGLMPVTGTGVAVTANGTVVAIGHRGIASVFPGVTRWITRFDLDGRALAASSPAAIEDGVPLYEIDEPLQVVAQGAAAFVLGQRTESGCSFTSCIVHQWLRRHEPGGLTWNRDIQLGWPLAVTARAGALYAGGVADSQTQIVRVDPASGATLWTRTVVSPPPSRNANFYGLTVTDDAAAIVAAGSGEAAFVRRYAANGDVEWTTPTPGDGFRPDALAADSTGAVYVVGRRRISGSARTDLWIARYEPDGSLSWLRTRDGELPAPEPGNGDHWNGVAVDGRDALVAIGVASVAGGYVALTRSYAPDGILRWADELPLPASQLVSSGVPAQVVVDARGSAYVENNVPRVRKFSAGGNIIWDRTLPGVRAVALGPGDEVIALANATSDGIPQLMRLDPGPQAAAPTLQLAPLPSPLIASRAITLVARVGGTPVPTGTMTFAVNGIPVCDAIPLVASGATSAAASCTLPSGLPAGRSVITLRYGGDAEHAPTAVDVAIVADSPDQVAVPALGPASLLLLAVLIGIVGVHARRRPHP